MSDQSDSAGQKVLSKVIGGLESLAKAATDRAMSKLTEKVDQITDKLTDYASGNGGPGGAAISKGMEKLQEGGSPVSAAVGAVGAGGKEQVKQAFGGGGGGDSSSNQAKTDLKVTNIVESIDVGVPVWLAYNQWTQFKDFPSYMKKVENVEQESEEKLLWQAQVLWSHRKWESTIIEQVPDERIVWQSEGDKGSVDGTVSFHELTPDLTRILVVLQYHPKGFVEKTGNIWRAPGRRVRLELKHFVRHVMSETVLHPDEVQGWRGEIRDGEVVAGPEENPPPIKPKDQDAQADAQQQQKQPEQDAAEHDGGNQRDQQPAADSNDGGRKSNKSAKSAADR